MPLFNKRPYNKLITKARITPEYELVPEIYKTNNGYLGVDSSSNIWTGISTYTGFAPHGAFYEGWTSGRVENIARAKWDFGPGSENDFGGRIFYGINAAHVHETPGVYPVTLEVEDIHGNITTDTLIVTVMSSGEGGGYKPMLTQVGTITATISSPNVTGSGTNFSSRWVGSKLYNNSNQLIGIVATITDATHLTLSANAAVAISTSFKAEHLHRTFYVDSLIGNDIYDGLSQTVDGGNRGPWASYSRAIDALRKSGGWSIAQWPTKPGDKILFKRGLTYNAYLQSFAGIGHGQLCQGVHVGAYGTGNKPIIQYKSPVGTAVYQPNTLYNVGDCAASNIGDNRLYQCKTAFTSQALYTITAATLNGTVTLTNVTSTSKLVVGNWVKGGPITKPNKITAVNGETGTGPYNYTSIVVQIQVGGTFSPITVEPALDTTKFTNITPTFFGGTQSAIGKGIIAITDLDFQSFDGLTNAEAIWGTAGFSRNVTFLRCNFDNQYNTAIGLQGTEYLIGPISGTASNKGIYNVTSAIKLGNSSTDKNTAVTFVDPRFPGGKITTDTNRTVASIVAATIDGTNTLTNVTVGTAAGNSVSLAVGDVLGDGVIGQTPTTITAIGTKTGTGPFIYDYITVDRPISGTFSNITINPVFLGEVATGLPPRSFTYTYVHIGNVASSGSLSVGAYAWSGSIEYNVIAMGNTGSQKDVSQASVVGFMFGNALGLGLIGNKFDKTGNHINYLIGMWRSVITDNIFSRPSFGRTALRVTGAHYTPTRSMYVARNKFLGWIDPQGYDIVPGRANHNGGGNRYNYALVTMAPNGSPNEYADDYLFENNIITNSESCLSITNYRNDLIRNNIIYSPSKYATPIVFGMTPLVQNRVLENIKVYNNTIVTLSDITNIVINIITIKHTNNKGLYHKSIELRNNLIISRGGRNDNMLSFEDLTAVNNGQIENMRIDDNQYDTTNATPIKIVTTNKSLSEFTTTYQKDVNSVIGANSSGLSITPFTHAPGYPQSQADCIAEADLLYILLQPTSSTHKTINKLSYYDANNVKNMDQYVGALQGINPNIIVNTGSVVCEWHFGLPTYNTIQWGSSTGNYTNSLSNITTKASDHSYYLNSSNGIVSGSTIYLRVGNSNDNIHWNYSKEYVINIK